MIRTIVEALEDRVARQPDRAVFTFLADGETESETLTYGDLQERAKAVAASLTAADLRDERVLLLLPSGVEFLIALWGCFLARCIAVPVAVATRERQVARIAAIYSDARPAAVLTNSSMLAIHRDGFAERGIASGLEWLLVDDIQGARDWTPPGIQPSTIAYLQYTSGSTSAPKGVVITHGNVVANAECIRRRYDAEESDVVVSWVPHFHDMGLMDGYLSPTCIGVRAYVMRPASFIQKPIRWLRAISRYHATYASGPNFAYQICVDATTMEERRGLDLSSWRGAINGAEPIRAETLQRFSETFSPYGFRPETHSPSYGLAESVVLVSALEPGVRPTILTVSSSSLAAGTVTPCSEIDEGAKSLVGCGRAAPSTTVKIVDPEGRPLPEGQVGEIWISGPSISPGYWNQPTLNSAQFGHKLSPSDGEQYLSTGDLGFEHSGELFCSGRIRDMILIRGRNHYPHDIEETVARAHPAVMPGLGVAFSFEVDGIERLAIVQEVRRTHRRQLDGGDVARAVRSSIAEAHELHVEALVLLRPGTLPETSSGQGQRQQTKSDFLSDQLASIYSQRWDSPASASFTGAAPKAGPTDLATFISEWVSNATGLSSDQIDDFVPFSEYGLDSIQCVALSGALARRLRREFPETLVIDYPTVDTLVRHLNDAPSPQRAESTSQPTGTRDEIAVVSVACRLPGGVVAPDDFWDLLSNGVDAISPIPEDRWNSGRFYDPRPGTPGKTIAREGGFLSDIADFDPGFFGISPREATAMDPQHRLLLEASWEAVERAGLTRQSIGGTSTGVFFGISGSEYAFLTLRPDNPEVIDGYAGTGSAPSIAAGRIAYWLDLQGPALSIDTACSSSLVAVHLACQSLRTGESDMALAGGVNLTLRPEHSIYLSQVGALSPTDRCHPFSSSADGYVRSEGCGVVLLKRLKDAIRDGDPILAIVRGSATGQDGRTQGLTAPSGNAQAAVLRRAIRDAGCSAKDIGYVEAHGTGTPLGDPIEIRALAEVYGAGRRDSDPLIVGSVKSNIGHCEAAAGIAGFIKTVLALGQRKIPQSLHSEELNPRLDWAGLPIRVAQAHSSWRQRKGPRLAGVSSFGFSGTNAHVILEEPRGREIPEIAVEEAGAGESRSRVFPITAHDPAALRDQISRLLEFVSTQHQVTAADLSYTLCCRKDHYKERLVLFAQENDELLCALDNALSGAAPAERVRGTAEVRGKTAFLFPELGAGWSCGARELLASEPAFTRAFSACSRALEQHTGWSANQILENSTAEAASVDRESVRQPLLFCVQTALAAMWKSWGLKADVVLGHGPGEVAAAYVAGVLDLGCAAKLISEQGRALEQLAGLGGMGLVGLPISDTVPYVEPMDRLYIAGSWSPDSTLVSGESTALTSFLEEMKDRGVSARSLSVDYPAHCPQLAPMLEELRSKISRITTSAGSCAFYSGTRSERVDPAALDSDYWTECLRQPIRFDHSLERLLDEGCRFFIELSPRGTLVEPVRAALRAHGCKGTAVASLAPERRAIETMTHSLAQLFASGHSIDWNAVCERTTVGSAEPRLLQLPTYPFQRKSYWVEGARTKPGSSTRLSDDLLMEVQWAEMPRGRDSDAQITVPGHWLIFGDRAGMADQLAPRLEAAGHTTTVVRAATGQVPGSDSRTASEVAAILSMALDGDRPLVGVAYLWGLDDPHLTSASGDKVHLGMLGWTGALHLCQAMASLPLDCFPKLVLVTDNCQPALSGAPIAPEQALLWGLAAVIRGEHPEWETARVDISDPVSEAEAVALAGELLGTVAEDQVAIRGTSRYAARLARIERNQAEERASKSSPEIIPTYLITGGLGALGLAMARWLAELGPAHLVLTGRHGITSDAQRAAIASLEESGAQVTIAPADAASLASLDTVIRRHCDGRSPLRGVIHAAGVLDDGLITNQNTARFLGVLAPKAMGAWNLHLLTQSLPLDFFILCSSAAGLLGSPGQANYCAANSFLDALAHHRRSLGHTATSIDWGPLAGLGMAARATDWNKQLAHRGIRGLTEEEAREAFSLAIRTDRPQLAAAAISFRQWIEYFPQHAGWTFIAGLLDGGEPISVPTANRELLENLAQQSASGRRKRLREYLRDEVSTVLGLPNANVGEEVPLADLGLDSLIGLELRNRLERSLAIRLPATMAWLYPTIAALSEHLALSIEGRQIAQEEIRSEPRPPDPTPEDDDSALLKEISELEDILDG